MRNANTPKRTQDDNFKPVGAKVLEEFNTWVKAGASGQPTYSLDPVNHEGWRVAVDEGDGKRGWALLRQSLHDPLLVLNVESDVKGGEQGRWCLGWSGVVDSLRRPPLPRPSTSSLFPTYQSTPRRGGHPRPHPKGVPQQPRGRPGSFRPAVMDSPAGLSPPGPFAAAAVALDFSPPCSRSIA
jgi:hypothetical protein